MARAVKTIGILTSDGDAPGMNMAIRTVVRMTVNKGLKVKGITRSYAGLLKGEIVDMESTNVSDTINRGGTTLYTARCKKFTTPGGQQKGTEICRRHGIDGMVVTGGDGSFRGTGKPSSLGINIIGLPGVIDPNIACTDYTIGFDAAVSTAMEVIDKIRDTSTSHKRCSIVKVMGRSAGYIALWCSTANGAEDIPLPERYDGDEQALISRIIDNHRRGKKYNIIINAEGIGHFGSMAKHVEVATGIETRTMILGYMQRSGTPTCKDRVYASIMGTKMTELLTEGKSNRLVAYKHGGFVNYDIQKTLNISKDIPEEQYKIIKILVR